MKNKEQFSQDELRSIQSGINELILQEIVYKNYFKTIYTIRSLWYIDLDRISFKRIKPETIPYEKVRESRIYQAPPARKRVLDTDPSLRHWLIGMTKEFLDAIKSIDRKLQGRILEAISHICTKPLVAYGDTIKPLTGDLKGYWRFRIGDYRLVYFPDEQNKKVVLIAFTNRGASYTKVE
jgi:mRNA interferase RelE/StbE